MTSSPNRVVLDIRDLSVVANLQGRRLPILSNISLEVHEAEIVGIVGESGSGKSTLARAVTRLLPPSLAITAGSIHLRDTDLLRSPAAAVHHLRPGGLSMVFQSPLTALNPLMPIGKQVAEAFTRLGISRRQALRRSVELLERMGIHEAASRLADYPHQFSGGQRQRIVIAIALAAQPSVLIADEPTSALDVTTQASILEMFSEIAQESSTAIVFISHNYAVVSSLCSRVLVLYAGQAMERGRAGTLLSDPRHPYTAALMASLPSIDRRVDSLHVIPGSPATPYDALTGCPFRPRCEHALDSCASAKIELRELSVGHATACVRADEIWTADGRPSTSGNRVTVESAGDYAG